MFVRKMGKKDPPNVKVGLTANEAQYLIRDLEHVIQLLDDNPCPIVGDKDHNTSCALDRLVDLVAALKGGSAR